ncbi:conserved hypothetical protein [Burkholderia sp. 8Y]|uniref:DUF2278 family protein n=1 Tax=Burkholderia sp. 8Y TaxID=2653133 RepID=UPI0012F21E33|nr:DUF2278 family protein [Burkholderia sp. 8Y]VXB07770.1 conserved hypothetical protein [Burkholderia sp. 8Y]
MIERFRPAASKYVYGALVGHITDGKENPNGNSPHYEILVDAAGTPYRIAVNIRSVEGSEVLAYSDSQYSNDTKLGLSQRLSGTHGFTPLATGKNGQGLDYLRDDLFPLDEMKPVPPDGKGGTMSTLLDAQIQRVKNDAQAVVLAIGDKFDDYATREPLAFSLGRGVHDIHMMQGNSGSFADDNRINGDGALFIRFSGGETFALFVRFATQATLTDDNGNPAKRN